jgi:hypothetical protein
MLDNLLLGFITFLHIVLILLVVLIPFIGNNYLLLLHTIFLPFVVLHWYINDNTCCLTLMEQQLRYNINGTMPDNTQCISYKIIAPVYDFANDYDSYSNLIYIITFVLWSISLSKLICRIKNGKISSLYDFCF